MSLSIDISHPYLVKRCIRDTISANSSLKWYEKGYQRTFTSGLLYFSYYLEICERSVFSSLRSVFYLVLRFSELSLILLKMSIFVSKLAKVSVAYNPKPLTDTKATHVRIAKYPH